MLVSRSTLRHTLLAGLCASALVMGACSGGDKPVAEEITVDAPSLGLTSADESELAAHFRIAPRSGTEADTVALLSQAGLDGATYGERTINGSSVIYTDWTASQPDTTLNAETVELIGLHETDEGPTVDKLVVRGMSLLGTEGEGEDKITVMDTTVGGLVIVSPSASLFEDVGNTLMARDEGHDSTAETVDGLTREQDFRALQVENLTAKLSEEDRNGTLSIEQVIVGNDRDDERLDMVVETVSFDWSPIGDADPSRSFDLNMDGLTIMGLNTSEDASDALSQPNLGLMGGLMATLTPSGGLPYRSVDLGQFDLKSSMLDLSAEGFEASSETQGDETVLRSVLAPLVLTLKDVEGTPLASYIDVMRANGLAEITLKGSQTLTLDQNDDRMVVSDARLDVDGGLRTRCDYVVQGTQAAADALEQSGVSEPALVMEDDGPTEAAIEQYMAQMDAYRIAKTEAESLIKLESLNCDVQDVADNSLVDRGYAVAADVTGRPVAVLKGAAKTMVALGSLTARTEFERDVMDTIGSGVIDFIDQPGQTLTITMAPEDPVAITSLTGQDGMPTSLEPLGLTVEVR